MLRPLMAGHARRAQQLLAHPASRQLIRYIIAGLLVTWFAATIYTLLVSRHLSPYLANVGSTAGGLIAGYTIHSRWSFKDGRKDSETFQLGRFLAASGVAFGINTFWIWLTVKQLGLSSYAPVPLMMAATPILSFLLNRYWVFKAH
ncbi:GtrA family protein [Sphingomonas glaciei]|uniref:GtrA family protein n=1 Tax=Sphingomonas glaciei TaxID=2938948 RepID=A0ABY5MUR4_9SPHN|nr:GtrA family protein [Sphingomonas glaciei]UUR08187.1 GtrA family protein [Sphingomonas glaciei]